MKSLPVNITRLQKEIDDLSLITEAEPPVVTPDVVRDPSFELDFRRRQLVHPMHEKAVALRQLAEGREDRGLEVVGNLAAAGGSEGGRFGHVLS